MGQLQPHDEVAGRAELHRMRGNEVLAERGEVGERPWLDHELIRIGAAVGPNGDSFAAPNHLRAALSEPLPAAPRELARVPVDSAVPALHRQYREAVASP